MGRARRLTGLVTCLSLTAALSAPASQAQDPVAFPDGQWRGTAIWTGGISKADIFASGTGDVVFVLTIDDGQVTDGELAMEGVGKSKVPGGSGKLNLQALLELSGTASQIQAAGTLHYSGTVTVEGVGSVPVSGTVASGTGSFSPQFVTCNRVTGDLATQGRKIQQAAGFNTSVTAKFVAVREGEAKEPEAIERYKHVADALLSVLESARAGTTPSVEQVAQLVVQIEQVNETFHESSPCTGPVPPDFQEGTADPLFVELINQLALELLTNHEEKYSVHELLSLLVLIPRVGLTAQTEDAFVDVLAARIDDLVDALGQGVGANVYEDWPAELKALHEIYTTAQLLDLPELAALAKSALGNFVQVGVGPQEPVEV
jgi:hypothetical protein